MSVKHAVETCFRDVGHTDVTYGTFNHEFQGWMFLKYPDSMFAGIAQGTSKEQLDEFI